MNDALPHLATFDPRLVKRMRVGARIAERLTPLEFRHYCKSLPDHWGEIFMALPIYKPLFRDLRPWYTRTYPWGVSFHQNARQARNLVIGFTGANKRLGIPVNTVVSMFPRKNTDFAFAFDFTKSGFRVEGIRGDMRPKLYNELIDLASEYPNTIATGHSGGALAALEFQSIYPKSSAAAISPIQIRATRERHRKNFRNTGIAYDWICACKPAKTSPAKRRVIVASAANPRDAAFARFVANRTDSQLELWNRGQKHGIWQHDGTILRQYFIDMGTLLTKIGQ